MLVEKNVPLRPYNTFGIAAKALALVRVRSLEDLQSFSRLWRQQRAAATAPARRIAPQWEPLVLGGGSNIVLTGDVRRPVLKMEMSGRRVLREDAQGWLIEAGAGERWHELVRWTVEQGMPGLENMALIPGTVGAAPVQNIGAYGVELKDRLHSLDAFDLWTGRTFTLTAAQCGFSYRDSVFKHPARPAAGRTTPVADAGLVRATEQDVAPPPEEELVPSMGLGGRAVITHVRLWLPKAWQPVLGYHDLERYRAMTGVAAPTSRQIFEWVVAIRRDKLPDPAVIGNVGSFFKNPTVTQDQCRDIIAREPKIVHYPLPDGSVKLAAGWLIDACGWKGKSVGNAGVYARQALVLVNLGHGESSATGGEVMTLAKAIQTSVYERYGIRLEPEPIVV
ncbi:UDP-N-acetylenolpyruvoylglucosamine reductase [Lampropedia cohaerens]|uniref:UDP-N-acetylenolpyruvoylglucosamine reductase n=1 Tax=Lampropedia cohaerens TaxID=1610491 RepID=A0A0U1PWW3_9BURK|nr:UDP-N-acetylmuramate dehydrogenase [Lampropedia cohaerens]KKW66946.1 UDP-N-acetylenolpyruvoylglucosamine reductase [Lampropedia cohaerens]